MLKRLSEITTPDPRFAAMVVWRDGETPRSITLEDYYAGIAAISVSERSPESVRIVFERARNAFLYSWFAYDLTTLAAVQAYAALELALRERIGPKPDGRRWRGMRELMDHAREAGLLDGACLRGLRGDDAEVSLDHFISYAALFRNELAHGSEHLNVPGAALAVLSDCAAIINHLARS